MSIVITIEESREIAQAALDARASIQPLRLADEVIDRPLHWVWGFDSVAFLETGNPLLAVVGAGPIAVSKADGNVTILTGAFPVEDQV